MAHALRHLTRRPAQAGQVLVFFALVLPLVLFPAAAYAIDATVAATAYSRLVEVTVAAAEEAAQQVDVAALRAGHGVTLDLVHAEEAARLVISSELPGAGDVAVKVSGTEVSVATTEQIELPVDFLGPASVTMHSTATARIAAGYVSPSSRLPLPFSTF